MLITHINMKCETKPRSITHIDSVVQPKSFVICLSRDLSKPSTNIVDSIYLQNQGEIRDDTKEKSS